MWREREGGGSSFRRKDSGKMDKCLRGDKRLPGKLLLSKSSEKNKEHWAPFGLNIEGCRISETASGELGTGRERTVPLGGSGRGQRALFDCDCDNGLPGLSALVIWTFLTLKHLLLDLLKTGKPVSEGTELTPELLCFTASYLRLSCPCLDCPCHLGR